MWLVNPRHSLFTYPQYKLISKLFLTGDFSNHQLTEKTQLIHFAPTAPMQPKLNAWIWFIFPISNNPKFKSKSQRLKPYWKLPTPFPLSNPSPSSKTQHLDLIPNSISTKPKIKVQTPKTKTRPEPSNSISLQRKQNSNKLPQNYKPNRSHWNARTCGKTSDQRQRDPRRRRPEHGSEAPHRRRHGHRVRFCWDSLLNWQLCSTSLTETSLLESIDIFL